MKKFDPSAPAMVHDRLNDRTFGWKPAVMEANYRQYAVARAAHLARQNEPAPNMPVAQACGPQ